MHPQARAHLIAPASYGGMALRLLCKAVKRHDAGGYNVRPATWSFAVSAENTGQGAEMIESGRVWSDLPELDRANDPRGGAAAWAVLAVGTAFAAGILAAATWVTGVW
jgi:hypothetical protein